MGFDSSFYTRERTEFKDWIGQQWPCTCCVPVPGTKLQPLFSPTFGAVSIRPPPAPPTSSPSRLACETPEGRRQAKRFAQAPQSRIRLLKAALGTLLSPPSAPVPWGLLLNWNGFNLYTNKSYSWKQSTFGITCHRDSPKISSRPLISGETLKVLLLSLSLCSCDSVEDLVPCLRPCPFCLRPCPLCLRVVCYLMVFLPLIYVVFHICKNALHFLFSLVC